MQLSATLNREIPNQKKGEIPQGPKYILLERHVAGTVRLGWSIGYLLSKMQNVNARDNDRFGPSD